MRTVAYKLQNPRAWTPYREVIRYRRLLFASMALNVILAAALLKCLR
jgi:hypothetical protein